MLTKETHESGLEVSTSVIKSQVGSFQVLGSSGPLYSVQSQTPNFQEGSSLSMSKSSTLNDGKGAY